MNTPDEMRACGLDRSSPFSHACQGCGECCHHYLIQVNPYEVVRLARFRGVSTDEFSKHFMDGGTYLKHADGACVFLQGQRCGVHTARPLACRLYPLSRRLSADGTESFSCFNLAPNSRGCFTDTGTVADHLRAQNAQEFMDASDLYIALHHRLSAALEAPEGNIAEASLFADPARLLDADHMVALFCNRHNRPIPTEPMEYARVHIEAVDTWLALYLSGEKHE